MRDRGNPGWPAADAPGPPDVGRRVPRGTFVAQSKLGLFFHMQYDNTLCADNFENFTTCRPRVIMLLGWNHYEMTQNLNVHMLHSACTTPKLLNPD